MILLHRLWIDFLMQMGRVFQLSFAKYFLILSSSQHKKIDQAIFYFLHYFNKATQNPSLVFAFRVQRHFSPHQGFQVTNTAVQT